MSESSYGVVVERYAAEVSIWLLFRDDDGHLSGLPDHMCRDRLQLGDLVEARTNDSESIIRRCPPSDAVWTDGRRVVVRTIISYVRQVTIEAGKYTEDGTGNGFVILCSHDVGYVTAPVAWYNRMYSDANESRLLGYVEFHQRPFTNALTDERAEFFWTIVENRIAIPATPKPDVHSLMDVEEITKVPALVIKREEQLFLLWSYVLGTDVAVIKPSEMEECDADVGQWITVTVVPSPARDLEYYRCKYTVTKHDAVVSSAQPEVTIKDGQLLVELQLNKNVASVDTFVRLWNDHWGLDIDFDEKSFPWIAVVENEFKADVEIFLCNDVDAVAARKVALKVFDPDEPDETFEEDDAPAATARAFPSRLAARPPPTLAAFEDVTTLKKALHDAELGPAAQSELAQADQEDTVAARAASALSNDSNNNSNAAQTTPARTWSNAEIAPESYDAGWYDKAIKKDEEECARPFSPPSRPDSRASESPSSRPESRMTETSSRPGSRASESGSRSSGTINWRNWPSEEGEASGQEDDSTKEKQKGLKKGSEKGKLHKGVGVWTSNSGWDYERPSSQSSNPPSRGKGTYGRGRGAGYGFSTGRRPTRSTGPDGAGWGAPSQQATRPVNDDAASTTGASEDGSHEKPRKFIPILQYMKKEPSDDEEVDAPVEIRAYEDKEAERRWKREMTRKGWEFPPEPKPIVIPDGEDGWDSGLPISAIIANNNRPKPALPPVTEFINKRQIVRDAMKIKTLQCLIVRVRFDFAWKYADRVQLYVLDGTPTYCVHRMNNKSYLRDKKEFLTVGNVVECHIKRGHMGYEVYDEMWKFVTKIKMPMKERVFEDGRCKALRLISNAKCISPEGQDRHNDRWRYNQRGFTMLVDEILHNIVYYGKKIDAREYEDYSFQVEVEPEEVLKEHTFWKVVDVLIKVKKEVPQHFGPGPVPEYLLNRAEFPPLPPTAPVQVEFAASQNTHDMYFQSRVNYPVTYPRETRLDELFLLYGKLMENEMLMSTLLMRTGTDYKKKFANAIDIGQTAMPHQKSMKRELQVNADFLISITENAYAEAIFTELGEKRLWRSLQKTSDSIKAFRSTVNNR